MQLFIILALLLYGGKANAQNLLSEVKPVLETVGGEGMKEALKSAEEISQVLSAVQGITSAMQPQKTQAPAEQPVPSPAINFPLSPVSNIADRDITYSLSRYISEN